MNHSRERGFIPSKPVFGRDYIQGSPVRLGGSAITNGQWDKFLPPFEKQKKGTETQACATFNTFACIETLQRALYKVETEWSDRFTAKMSGTTKAGNDPHTVAESIRKQGSVYEEEWPFTDSMTWEDFYSGIPHWVITKAQVQFRSVYEFGHEYVGKWRFASGILGVFQRILGAIFPRLGGKLQVTPEEMMDALKYSPLGVDVDAWHKKGDYYIRTGPSNHWVMLYGFKEGEYWKCYDSYDRFKKKLAWDYGFTIAKRYTLEKQVEVTQPLHPLYLWWQAINFFKRIWSS